MSVCCCVFTAEPVKGAEIDVLSGPVEFIEGKTLELRCKLTAGNHVSYKWLVNGRLVSQSPLHYDHLSISRSVESQGVMVICMYSQQSSSSRITGFHFYVTAGCIFAAILSTIC